MVAMEIKTQPHAHITLADIQRIQTPLQVLGFTVFWRLSGIRVKHSALKKALKAHGFEAFLPEPPSARKALRRALMHWMMERTQKQIKKKRGKQRKRSGGRELDETDAAESGRNNLIRVINSRNSKYMAFGIVAEDVDFNELGLSYGTDLRIMLEKGGRFQVQDKKKKKNGDAPEADATQAEKKEGRLICTTEAQGKPEAVNESLDIAAQLQPFWQRYRNLHISSDLSRMMLRIIDSLGANSLRSGGGLYFVPAEQEAALDRFRSLLDSLPREGDYDPFICKIEVTDTKSTKIDLARAIHTSILDEVASMRTDLERFVDAPPRTVCRETVSDRLTQYQKLRDKVHVYTDLLNMRKTDLQEELNDLTRTAKSIITGDRTPKKRRRRAEIRPDGEAASQVKSSRPRRKTSAQRRDTAVN